MYENVMIFSVIFSECCNMQLMIIDVFLWGENFYYWIILQSMDRD